MIRGRTGQPAAMAGETYQPYFVEMSAGWNRIFLTYSITTFFKSGRIPGAWADEPAPGDMLREKQRTLPQLYSNMSIMSTLGIVPPGPCHFPLVGWGEFAHLIQPLMERDHYGKAPDKSITPPNLQQAAFAEGTKDTLLLTFDQPVVWNDSLKGQFYPDGEKDKIASGSAAGSVLTLKLKDPSSAATITYLKRQRGIKPRRSAARTGSPPSRSAMSRATGGAPR